MSICVQVVHLPHNHVNERLSKSMNDLARHPFMNSGARVIMACRDLEKAKAAQTEVVKESGSSDVVVKKLDLASLKSVREFAEQIKSEESRLDVLLNNAGIKHISGFKFNLI